MNRYKKLSMITLIIAMIIGGCSKDELTTKNDQELREAVNNASATSRALIRRTLWTWTDVFYDYVTGETHTWDHVLFCAWPAGNCLPTYVVRRSSIAGKSNFDRYEEFERHVESETTHLYFSGRDYKAFVPGIDSMPQALTKLRNGNVKFFKWQNQNENYNSYFIGFDRDLPDTLWTESNAEVTFEFIFSE